MNMTEIDLDLYALREIPLEERCDSCNGGGTMVYGSTATWRGGVGGAAMTEDVCSKCWGSGKKHHPWPSWRGRK